MRQNTMELSDYANEGKGSPTGEAMKSELSIFSQIAESFAKLDPVSIVSMISRTPEDKVTPNGVTSTYPYVIERQSHG